MQGPQYIYNGPVNLAELERVNLSGARLYFNASHCDFQDLQRLDLRATETFFNGIRVEVRPLSVEAQRSRSRCRISMDSYRPKCRSECDRPSMGDSNEITFETRGSHRKKNKIEHLKELDWPELPDIRAQENSEHESDLVMSNNYPQKLNRLGHTGPTETLETSGNQWHGILEELMFEDTPYQSTWPAAMTGFADNGSSTHLDVRRSPAKNKGYRKLNVQRQKINPDRMMLLNRPKSSSPLPEEVPYMAKGANTVPLGERGRRNTLEGEVREKMSDAAKRIVAKAASTEIHPERLESLKRPRSPSPEPEPPAYVANGANASAVGKSRLHSHPAQSRAPTQTDGSGFHTLPRRSQRIGSSGLNIGSMEILKQGRLTPKYGSRAFLSINFASERKNPSHTPLRRDRCRQNSFLSVIGPSLTAGEKTKLQERAHSQVGNRTRRKDVLKSSPFSTVTPLDNALSRAQVTRDHHHHLQRGQPRGEQQKGSAADEKTRQAHENYSQAEKVLRRQRGQYGRALPSAVQAVKEAGRALAALYEINGAGNIMTTHHVSAVKVLNEFPQIQVKQEQMEEKILGVTSSDNGKVREGSATKAIDERDSIKSIVPERQTYSAMSDVELFLERLGQAEAEMEL